MAHHHSPLCLQQAAKRLGVRPGLRVRNSFDSDFHV